MTKQEMLDKLRTMEGIVENAPAGVEFSSAEIADKHLRELPAIMLKNGIETFREPVGFLYSSESYNWFGFQAEGILVYQAFAREDGCSDAQVP